MLSTDTSATLIGAISDLQEDTVLALIGQRLAAGEDPLLIIEACQEGMRQVGLRYERHEYYLAGLIMAGEILSQVMELLRPVVERRVSDRASGCILLGTVRGDIHDLGKNIVTMLLSCHHFAVHDLGVDVSPSTFVEQAAELQPHVVGLSGLLTSAYDAMRETVTLLRAQGYQRPIIIGGGQISEEVCRYVGADYWATDGVAGTALCKRLMASAQ
ncbi:MAG TPA: cobalamin-dependent protein [Anaerolineae bacterium]|nr:cobalamin-dependent protein [Anaerolineae bacterium]HOQ99376.1 cobalamin-dependent protein [Anaerolineae bacterium]HPL28465.1 cobalamin-dependent protein [Anaerolineae bacterium]